MNGLLRALILVGLCCSLGAQAQVFVSREPASAVRARVMELVNDARAQGRRCGRDYHDAAGPLADSSSLRKAAQRHAEDMARRKYFDHRGADGSQPKDRVQRAGYAPRLTGENIAFAPESAEEVVAGWLASPGHCANIMDARFTETGIAVATGRQRGHIYWVQVFGSPQRMQR
jgi:uncharacterized protein YkwD